MAEPAHAAIGATDVGPVDVLDIGLGPVRLGAMLFTMVDPHRGYEAAYNRWYERDHLMAGCTVGPYCFGAKRWVATRACKDLRHVTAGNPVADDPMRGSYLAMYWLLQGWVQEWNRWAFREFRWLHENGRMFPHRDHVHTLLYEHDWAHYEDEDPVPASLALQHPYAGVAVVVGEAVDGDRGRLDAWWRDEALPGGSLGDAVGMTLSFSGIPLEVEAKDVARDDGGAGRFLHLHFLREDPLAVWQDTFARLPEAVDRSGLGRVTWAGPFLPTVVGTDTHADQLW